MSENKIINGLKAAWELPKKLKSDSLSEALFTLRGFAPEERDPDPRTDPLLPSAAEFAGRFLAAVKPGEKIIINGDYDVDGVCSSAVFGAMAEAIGIKVCIELPNRFTDGYGVALDAVERAIDAGCSALVTLDCGSADTERLSDLAARKNIPVFIVDHHLVGERKPVSGIVEFNPSAIAASNPENYCAGVLCMLIAMAVSEKYEEVREYLPDFIFLAGLAAIADVSGLRGPASRAAAKKLLKEGWKANNHGVRALYEAAGLAGEITSSDVGFKIAPMINAAGRLDSATLALQLFSAQTANQASAAVYPLATLNKKRQALQNEMVTSAIKAHLVRNNQNVVMEWQNDWHAGMVGPVAGRLVERFGVPAFLGSVLEDRNSITFSARSVPGIDIHGVVSECAVGLPLIFGGHKMAMGMRVENSQKGIATIDELRLRVSEYLPAPSKTTRKIDRFLSAESVNWLNFQELQSVEPFGTGNARPMLCVPNVSVAVSHNPRGTMLTGVATDSAGNTFIVRAFRMDTLSGTARFTGHLIGTLTSKQFGVERAVEFLIEDAVILD